MLGNPVNWYDPLGLLTYVVADDIVELARGDNILRFSDTKSLAEAITKIPQGENEIVIIAHGEKEGGGRIEVGKKIIGGPDIYGPLIANKGNFSDNVVIDLRICCLLKGELGQQIKCELNRNMPNATIIGSSGLINYWSGTMCLWPYVFTFSSSMPSLLY